MKEALEALDTLIEKASILKEFLQDAVSLQNELLEKIDRTQKGAAEELLDRLP